MKLLFDWIQLCHAPSGLLTRLSFQFTEKNSKLKINNVNSRGHVEFLYFLKISLSVRKMSSVFLISDLITVEILQFEKANENSIVMKLIPVV